MSLPAVASIILCLGFPLLARWCIRRGYFPGWLSSIIACYAIGILVANSRLWLQDNQLLEQVAGGSMLIGLPLLLFSVRVRESLVYARAMLLGFALCALAGLVITPLAGLYYMQCVPDGWRVTGMLMGLYTGGTPNVQAIGLALGAPAEYLVLVQAADVLLGGAYLLALVTVLPAVYARFFPASGGEPVLPGRKLRERVSTSRQWAQFATGLTTAGLAAGLTYLITGGLDNSTLLILLLTTFSLVVASSRLRTGIGNSYPLGEYFILVFCVALGLLADFRALAESGKYLLLFSAVALTGTTLLHLLLCRWLKLDRDTVILSSVAAFYGPVFVVQVAAAIDNRRLLAPGVAVSLLGLGLGNYLGIGLAYLTRWLFY